MQLARHAEHEARVARALAQRGPQRERERQRHGQHGACVALCEVSRADGDVGVAVAQLAHGRAQPHALAELCGQCPGERVVASGQALGCPFVAAPARSSALASQAAETRSSSTV